MPDSSAAGSGEFNLCGVLVQTRPERVEDLTRALRGLPGVEVHHGAADGRLVVSVEDTDESFAGDTLSRIHRIDGVICAALVYHHCEPREAAGPGCTPARSSPHPQP
jgi:nitrate reductase NapD